MRLTSHVVSLLRDIPKMVLTPVGVIFGNFSHAFRNSANAWRTQAQFNCIKGVKMANIPTKTKDRLANGIKRFQPILAAAKSRDVNEADTVTIIKDILSEVFGFDKYGEITAEHAIRGTFVDLAIKLDNALQMLIEVKAIGLDLKEAHIKQAVDYAVNQGIEWVILTNGVYWMVYRVFFKQPIEQELVIKIDFLGLNPKSEESLADIFLLSREAMIKSLLNDYHAQRQALSRYFVGAILLSPSILDVIRRELRRLSPDVRIDNEQIASVMYQEVIKREVVEGERAEEARKKITKTLARLQRKTDKGNSSKDNDLPKEEIYPENVDKAEIK